MMGKSLRVLQVARDLVAEKGMWPTYRTLAKACGFASTCAIDYHLRKLEDAGFIERDLSCGRNGIYKIVSSLEGVK